MFRNYAWIALATTSIWSVTVNAQETVDFDWGWKFVLNGEEGAENIAFNDQDWRDLDLPHDWSIEGPFAEENPAGSRGGYLPGGIGWYRKHFTVPNAWRGKKVYVEFDGIYWQSKVWINDHLLGFRPSGYVSFHYDLTEHLHFGGEDNVIAVRVDNSFMPNERWYTGSGIYRHTRLLAMEPVHLERWGTFMSVREITEQRARVEVETEIVNDASGPRGATLTTSVFSPAGLLVAKEATEGAVEPGRKATLKQSLLVDSPYLWSPDAPHLYRLQSALTVNGEAADTAKTNFGIRTIRFDADQGLFVNGEPTLIKGMCMHDDLGVVGSAFVDAMLERRLRMLKEMGCNAIRTAHNPPAPQLLEMCDRIGLLVDAEAFDKWERPPGPLRDTTGYFAYFEEWHERDLRNFIRRYRNHPCIMMWSLGNEIGEQGRENGVEVVRRLKEITLEEDPTRPVTAGLNSINGANKYGFASVLDVVGFNGKSLAYYAENHAQYPDRPHYGSEIPHSRITRGVYKTTTLIEEPLPEYAIGDLAPEEVFPEFGEAYRSSYDNSFTRISAMDSWRLCDTRPYVAGEFRWTGFDYLGEAGYAGGWPARSGDKGVFDLCGFKKDIYYFYKSRWTDETVLHLLPHWTWPGKEGVTIPVWCYTNCDEVELFINGKSLGRKRLDPPLVYHLAWDVPYAPGVLRAIGWEDGVAVAECAVQTAGEPARLLLVTDRGELAADGRDVAHQEVQVVDDLGNLVPHADNEVRFEIQGPGRIIGIGNGDICNHQNFEGDKVKAFHGMCMAVVQTLRGAPGAITVTAKAAGLKGGTALISAHR